MIKCKYHGETVNGVPQGFGKVEYYHQRNSWLNFWGICQFINGIINGFSILFCGNSYRLGTYKNGKKEGFFRKYDLKGTLQQEMIHKKHCKQKGIYVLKNGEIFDGNF